MKKITFSICCLLANLCIEAQDIHFSQLYNCPQQLNPAMTGMFNADFRLTANYRSQWSSVTKGFQTVAGSAEVNILQGFTEDDYVGAGILLFNDKAGDSEFSTTNLAISASYNKSLDYDVDNYLSVGFQVGALQRNINYGALLFDNQYDGIILDPNRSSGENFGRQQFTMIDVSAGLGWYMIPAPNTSVHIGAAGFHLNEPNEALLGGGKAKLSRRYVVHANGELPIGETGMSILPRLVYMRQNKASEITGGALWKIAFSKKEDNNSSMSLGAMYRFGDAGIAMARFDFGSLGIAFSYDFNTSLLNRASRTNGGPEIALMYTATIWKEARLRRAKPVGCPHF